MIKKFKNRKIMLMPFLNDLFEKFKKDSFSLNELGWYTHYLLETYSEESAGKEDEITDVENITIFPDAHDIGFTMPRGKALVFCCKIGGKFETLVFFDKTYTSIAENLTKFVFNSSYDKYRYFTLCCTYDEVNNCDDLEDFKDLVEKYVKDNVWSIWV